MDLQESANVGWFAMYAVMHSSSQNERLVMAKNETLTINAMAHITSAGRSGAGAEQRAVRRDFAGS